MSQYLSLYRKYRPQSFSEMIGQEAIVQTLSNGLRMNRIAHAYLFSGPRGTGKTSTARLLAKALNCEKGVTPEPCNSCSLCTAIAQGNAPDVIEIDAASYTGVENIRDVIESSRFVPVQGRYKVYIIDEVHMLSTSAFNALLKTLEEPPSHVIFILATTEPHKVLPTIVSRCQRYDFHSVTTKDLTEHLSQVARKENISIEPAALKVIAQKAYGGVRDALSLLDQIRSTHSERATISVKEVLELFGALGEESLLQISRAILEKNTLTALRTVNDLLYAGKEPSGIVKDLAEHFRNIFITKLAQGQETSLLILDPDFTAEYQAQANQFREEELSVIIETLNQSERTIKHSTQPQIWLEVTIMKLASQTVPTYWELIERIKTLEEKISSLSVSRNMPTFTPQKPAGISPPAKTASSAISKPVTSSPPSTQEAREATTPPAPAKPFAEGSAGPLWTQILGNIKSPITKALLQQHAYLKAVEKHHLTIAFENGSFLHNFDNLRSRKAMEEALKLILGQVSYTVEIGSKEEMQIFHQAISQSALSPASINAQETTSSSIPLQQEPAAENKSLSDIAVELFNGKKISRAE